MTAFLLSVALIVGTWNGHWFPSGYATQYAHPLVEDATITAAAAMLRSRLGMMDPDGTNDVILVFNEMRNATVVSDLISRIGRPKLSLAAISAYRRRTGYDWQQDAIATTLPYVKAGWHAWADCAEKTPPRGYAYAKVIVSPAVTTIVYAVHLKANYKARDSQVAELNRTKRTLSVQELLRETPVGRCIIAGDLNADCWRKEFSDERIFTLLEGAGYLNVLGLLPPRQRGTYRHGSYPKSALDYIFTRGFVTAAKPSVVSMGEISDHAAVFAVLDVADSQ